MKGSAQDSTNNLRANSLIETDQVGGGGTSVLVGRLPRNSV